jgi:hypothetical protein
MVLAALVGLLVFAPPASAQGYLMGLDPTMPPVFIAQPYAGPTLLVPEPRMLPPPIVRPFFSGTPGYATFYPAPIVQPNQAPRIWSFTIQVARRDASPREEPPPPPPPEPQPEPRKAGPKVVWIGPRP